MNPDTTKLTFFNNITQNQWFAPAGFGLIVYLILGLFEESFGITKPIRIVLSIVALFVYKNYGDIAMAQIATLFASFGLSI